MAVGRTRADVAQRVVATVAGIAVGVLTFAGVYRTENLLVFVAVFVGLTVSWLVGARRRWRRVAEGLLAGFLVVVVVMVAYVFVLGMTLGS